jgi:chromosome segregation ATPase
MSTDAEQQAEESAIEDLRDLPFTRPAEAPAVAKAARRTRKARADLKATEDALEEAREALETAEDELREAKAARAVGDATEDEVGRAEEAVRAAGADAERLEDEVESLTDGIELLERKEHAARAAARAKLKGWLFPIYERRLKRAADAMDEADRAVTEVCEAGALIQANKFPRPPANLVVPHSAAVMTSMGNVQYTAEKLRGAVRRAGLHMPA